MSAALERAFFPDHEAAEGDLARREVVDGIEAFDTGQIHMNEQRARQFRSGEIGFLHPGAGQIGSIEECIAQ